MFVAKRSHHNPILVPDLDHPWEAWAVFNLSPVKVADKTFGLYRAISAVDPLSTPNQMSVIGIGESPDGLHFENRREFIAPATDWDKYGCEDPRVTFFEGKYYTFYTALSGYPFGADNIKVAVAVSSDLATVESRHLVTPFNAKAMTLFPERINGKVTAMFSFHTDMPPAQIAFVQADSIEEFWSEAFWADWQQKVSEHTIDLRRLPYDHVEIGAAPIRTKDGWLIVFSYIQNYFPSPQNFPRIFGIEAVLLDLEDPRMILGRTKGPILAPEESYELRGYVPDVIFPSGALLEDDALTIYYGAADTTVSAARVLLRDLLGSIAPLKKDEWHFKRRATAPILLPIPEHAWEAKAAFNPAAIVLGGKTHILYRALSNDNTSTVGYASSMDGVTIDERLPEPIYVPRADFESKKISNANSGCEDPRITQIGDRLYMCYTAYDSIDLPRVAVSSISQSDFERQVWNWSTPQLITPGGMDDKDTCIFPEQFEKGYFVLHRMNNTICGDYLPSLDFSVSTVKKCIHVLGARTNMWDNNKVGISAPPIKTDAGWLLFYHGISKTHATYRVGVALLDLNDPTVVLARATDPIFEPEERYEKEGIVNNVVFPCGVTLKDGMLYMYYGGADTVVGVSSMKLSVVMDALTGGSTL